MEKKQLTYGVFVEVIEDWVKQNKTNNKVFVQVLENGELITQIRVGGIHYPEDDDTAYLMTKQLDEPEIHEGGVLLNGDTPKRIHEDIIEINKRYNLSSNTPVGIEVWFDNTIENDGEIQYMTESHNYSIDDKCLILQHDIHESIPANDNDEFKMLIKEQYVTEA